GTSSCVTCTASSRRTATARRGKVGNERVQVRLWPEAHGEWKVALRRFRGVSAMMTAVRLLGGVLLALGGLALAGGDEKPPWQRELKGEDAQKAEALEQRIGNLEAEGKFAEAVQPAEAVLALRQQGQGTTHWQAAGAARKLRGL